MLFNKAKVLFKYSKLRFLIFYEGSIIAILNKFFLSKLNHYSLCNVNETD